MLYWYLNLERRPDRDKKQRAHLIEKEYPEDIITRIEAVDREHYPSPMTLAMAAADDGFPQFQKLPILQHHIAFWGLNWSYMRALRDIAHQEETVVLALDDWGLSFYYSHFQILLEEIPDFDIAQISWNVHDLRPMMCQEFSKNWRRGIPSTGQDIVVFTPRGANALLEECLIQPYHAAEVVIQLLSRYSDEVVNCYSFKNPAAAIVGLDDQHDNMVDLCYQGNYHKDGYRVTDATAVPTESTPRVKSLRQRLESR